jgi:hypothetical protein
MPWRNEYAKKKKFINYKFINFIQFKCCVFLAKSISNVLEKRFDGAFDALSSKIQ